MSKSKDYIEKMRGYIERFDEPITLANVIRDYMIELEQNGNLDDQLRGLLSRECTNMKNICENLDKAKDEEISDSMAHMYKYRHIYKERIYSDKHYRKDISNFNALEDILDGYYGNNKDDIEIKKYIDNGNEQLNLKIESGLINNQAQNEENIGIIQDNFNNINDKLNRFTRWFSCLDSYWTNMFYIPITLLILLVINDSI